MISGAFQAFRLLRLAAAGVLATVLGVCLLASGGQDGIVGGVGALFAGAIILGFVGYVGIRGVRMPGPGVVPGGSAGKGSKLLWAGILITLSPGLMYLYLRAAAYRQSEGATIFLSVPLMLAGLVMMGLGFWSITRK